MSTYDVLKDIVRNGSNLVICQSINYDALREIAALAHKSGARITVPATMNYDLVRARIPGTPYSILDAWTNAGLTNAGRLTNAVTNAGHKCGDSHLFLRSCPLFLRLRVGPSDGRVGPCHGSRESSSRTCPVRTDS